MNALYWCSGLRVLIPREERAEVKMLDDGELGQHLRVEHLYHALVDLAPSIAYTRYVEENRAMFPERSFFDVIDEAYGGEIHVGRAVVVDLFCIGNVAWFGGAANRALEGRGFGVVDGPRELRRAKNVGHKCMVVETPDAMRSCWFEIIG